MPHHPPRAPPHGTSPSQQRPIEDFKPPQKPSPSVWNAIDNMSVGLLTSLPATPRVQSLLDPPPPYAHGMIDNRAVTVITPPDVSLHFHPPTRSPSLAYFHLQDHSRQRFSLGLTVRLINTSEGICAIVQKSPPSVVATTPQTSTPFRIEGMCCNSYARTPSDGYLQLRCRVS